MKAFYLFFKIEFKQFLRRPQAVAFLVLFVLALFFVQEGINQHNNMMISKKEFQEVERGKVYLYRSYDYYGGVGLRSIFIPEIIMIFFNNFASISHLTSHFDSGDGLDLSRSFMGKNLFSIKSVSFNDFSGIILLFGSLLALYLGYEYLNNKEYVKHISSTLGNKRAFLFFHFSRVIILSLFLVLTTAFSLLLPVLNNITLKNGHYIHILKFLLVMVMVTTFFYFIGTVLGSIKSKRWGVAALFAIWFLSIFLIPSQLNKYIEKKSKRMTDNYRVEINRLTSLKEFEERAKAQEGEYDESKRNKKEVKTLVESYFNNEFKKIQEEDEKMEAGMRKLAVHYQQLCCFFPTTFYLSCESELSSGGYQGVLNFYRHSRQLKEKFTRYYLDKKFYSTEKKVQNFIKGDENIFYSRSHLPHLFWWGVLMTFTLTVLLSLFSYFRFCKYLFTPSKEDIEEFAGVEETFKKKQFRVWMIKSPSFVVVMYILLSGKIRWITGKDFKGKILFEDIDISKKPVREDIIYVCSPGSLPGDMDVRDYIRLNGAAVKVPGSRMKLLQNEPEIRRVWGKRFDRLSKSEKSTILLHIIGMGKHSVYLVNDITAGLPQEFFTRTNDTLVSMANEGALALYMTTTTPPVHKDDQDKKEKEFWEEEGWYDHVKLNKRMKSNREKEKNLVKKRKIK